MVVSKTNYCSLETKVL